VGYYFVRISYYFVFDGWLVAGLQYLEIYLTRVDSLRRRMSDGLDFQLIRQTFMV
jgi:hypothetical protein